MTASTDLVVIHSPVGGGHKAAANAVAEAARARGLEVEVLDLFQHAPKLAGDAYLQAHLTGQCALPDLYGSAFFAANHRGGAFEPVRKRIDAIVFGEILASVLDRAPRAIVSTHHLPLVVLGDARIRGRLGVPLLGVVTDYVAHACWAEAGVDAFTVPCERARSDLREHGVSQDRIAITGIPVRPAFERIPTAAPPLPAEDLRVLVTSGGFGVGPLRAIVRSFAGFARVRLTVVCGRAEALASRVRRDARELGVRAEVLGYENDMPSRVAAADVVVGKAGGLTVSETLAAGRPMVIVGAVPGNEAINEAFVVSGGAGHAAEARDVGRVIDCMRRHEELEWMGKRARQLVVPCSADRVVDAALAIALPADRRTPRAA
jgi:processive 1,2-diacylglycerol beta-glucosyltransferase